MKKSRNPPATSFRGDCGSKVRGYVRDLPGTYLVRVPGTVCHKALFVCEIKSPICFGFMPSLYLVKSASSARLFAGLQLLVLCFSGRDTPCRMSDRGDAPAGGEAGKEGWYSMGSFCFNVCSHVAKLRLLPLSDKKSKKKEICFQTGREKKQCITYGYKRYGVTVVTVTVSQMDKAPRLKRKRDNNNINTSLIFHLVR